MGNKRPSGASGASIANQMRRDSGGRDPQTMGGFRNSPLRQEERRPQAGVQDARDRVRDAADRRDRFDRTARERKLMDTQKAMEQMMRKQADDEVKAGGPGGYFRGPGPDRPMRGPSSSADGAEIGLPGAPDTSFFPNPAADLSEPGGERYGNMRSVLGGMQEQKNRARMKADKRQSMFRREMERMRKAAMEPGAQEFGGSNLMRMGEPNSMMGSFASQMGLPDARSQMNFRDTFLGMADMRNAMGGEEQQRRFRAQQFRPEYGQENVGRLRYANDPETLPPGTF